MNRVRAPPIPFAGPGFALTIQSSPARIRPPAQIEGVRVPVVTTLTITAVVIHGLKKARRGAGQAELSEAESVLTPKIQGFVQDQVQAALKFGRAIVEEPGMSGTPDVLRAYWSGQKSLLDSSKTLALTLQAAQSAISPEGLLLVADARAGQQRVFLIAKLEHETGAQAKREKDPAGHLVYSMTFLDDLIFTKGSKVYKIGYFPHVASRLVPLDGIVVDRQVQGNGVAEYFRETFLGCAWKEKPEIMTERFMNVVQDWIDLVPDPAKRTRYQLALISEMQNNTQTLSVGGFATTHLEAADRGPFTRHANQTLPSTSVNKDLALVSGRLASVRMSTKKGVIVIAPPDTMKDDTVKVIDKPGGKAQITVTDDLDGTSGTGRLH